MLSQSIQQEISSILQQKGLAVYSIQFEPLTGGSINHSYKMIVNRSHSYFLKINHLHPLPDLFKKEKDGLSFLTAQKQIAIPGIIDYATFHNTQLLLMEWIPSGEKSTSFWKKFGEQLAALHHCSHSQFGFEDDNYMGLFLQHNKWQHDWCSFFIEQRLLPQIQIATQEGRLPTKDAESFHYIFKKMNSVFDNEAPCLLHGDLWSGNFICNEKSEAVLIDPAVYFGHRSVDLGMTTLFGGFDAPFYEAYHYHFPLLSGYKDQWQIANLYPLLIHLNLFGESYLPDIRKILDRYKHS